MGSGITTPGSGITDLGYDLGSQIMGLGSVNFSGIRDQNFGPKNGITDEKIYLVTTLLTSDFTPFSHFGDHLMLNLFTSIAFVCKALSCSWTACSFST